MSGIAEVLIKLGYKVTGSDLTKTKVSERLETMGAHVFEGHGPSHVEGADVVVASTAISSKNPEIKSSHQRGIPVIPRIEMLAEIARLKYTIAIAGTHGKTTTSSMVAQVLQHNDLDPTVIVGGRLKAVGTGGVLGSGDFLVAEADESDGSFLKLSPTISVITNIDDDHLDYYKSMENLEKAFIQFANLVPFYGKTFVCADDSGIKKILPKLKRRYATYGLSKNCDLRGVDLETSPNGTSFCVLSKGKNLGKIALPFSGEHNVRNALAAVAVGFSTGLSFTQIANALAQFLGVGRRLEHKGEADGVMVLDDYGHHPTEMKATIQAIQSRWPKKRLVVLFQPHRYSRTKSLFKEFAQVLREPPLVYLMPIYPAGEKPIKGVSSEMIAKQIKKNNWKKWESAKSIGELQNDLKSGDILLTLGAGDVWKIGEQFLDATFSLTSRLVHAIPTIKGRIKSEEPLARHCTWAIGGPAEVYVEIHQISELKKLIEFGIAHKVPIFILGWGSNVLLPDEGLRGCVVRLRGDFESIKFKGEEVFVGAGVHLPRLSRRCADKQLAGVEALAGVPGTVGGALMTNAGTPRGVIGDVLVSVDVIDGKGKVQTLKRDQIELGYRKSNLQGQWVVSATLNLKTSKNGDIKNRIKEELENREKTQPLGTKNVGSVFRNPDNDYAARLIEAVGLKGKSYGHVRFSPKHANFMENTGGATAEEAISLIKRAQGLVKEKFNIELQPEVKIVAQPAPLK